MGMGTKKAASAIYSQRAMHERYGLCTGKNHRPFIHFTKYKLVIDL